MGDIEMLNVQIKVIYLWQNGMAGACWDCRVYISMQC